MLEEGQEAAPKWAKMQQTVRCKWAKMQHTAQDERGCSQVLSGNWMELGSWSSRKGKHRSILTVWNISSVGLLGGRGQNRLFFRRSCPEQLVCLTGYVKNQCTQNLSCGSAPNRMQWACRSLGGDRWTAIWRGEGSHWSQNIGSLLPQVLSFLGRRRLF